MPPESSHFAVLGPQRRYWLPTDEWMPHNYVWDAAGGRWIHIDELPKEIKHAIEQV